MSARMRYGVEGPSFFPPAALAFLPPDFWTENLRVAFSVVALITSVSEPRKSGSC